MNFEAECPYCSSLFEVDASFAGFSVGCPSCGQALEIPALPEEGYVDPAVAPSLPAAPTRQVMPHLPGAQPPAYSGTPAQAGYPLPQPGQPPHGAYPHPGAAAMPGYRQPPAYPPPARRSGSPWKVLAGILGGVGAIIGFIFYMGWGSLDTEIKREVKGVNEDAPISLGPGVTLTGAEVGDGYGEMYINIRLAGITQLTAQQQSEEKKTMKETWLKELRSDRRGRQLLDKGLKVVFRYYGENGKKLLEYRVEG